MNPYSIRQTRNGHLRRAASPPPKFPVTVSVNGGELYSVYVRPGTRIARVVAPLIPRGCTLGSFEVVNALAPDRFIIKDITLPFVDGDILEITFA